MKGRIYLIPVTLGGDDHTAVIPDRTTEIMLRLRHFVVEDIKSSRRYLRRVDRAFPIDSSVFYELNEHTAESDIDHFLDPVHNGHDIGLMSEAGLPGIADPGARLISLAHRKKITVTPLSGPSSIIMALISSGLNGQNFSFNGYLPVKPDERVVKLREIERRARAGYAQIFIETPYRNQKTLESVIATCSNDTMLCIACDITLSNEWIRTMNISDWKKNIPDINNRLTVFILQ
jgi:16S rRNA (cytidine1402-2'-O)-methyltransferase